MNTNVSDNLKNDFGNVLTNEMFAQISKALSDPNRLQIIQMIVDQERCACKLLEHFNITQPTLSHHMRILSDCNLVKTRKDGKWSHYSMNMETMAAYKDYVDMLYKASQASAAAFEEGTLDQGCGHGNGCGTGNSFGTAVAD